VYSRVSSHCTISTHDKYANLDFISLQVGLNKTVEVVMGQRSMAVAVEEGVTGEEDKNIVLMTGVVAGTMTAEGVEDMTVVVLLSVVIMVSL